MKPPYPAKQRLFSTWRLGSVALIALLPCACVGNGVSNDSPLGWAPSSLDDADGGQSGDEGTQFAGPCLTDEHLAFLGQLDGGEGAATQVTLQEPLTPAATLHFDSLRGVVDGCSSGYFTSERAVPGEAVLVIVAYGEDESAPPHLSLVPVIGDEVLFSRDDPSQNMSLTELTGSNCFSLWEERRTSAPKSGDIRSDDQKIDKVAPTDCSPGG